LKIKHEKKDKNRLFSIILKIETAFK